MGKSWQVVALYLQMVFALVLGSARVAIADPIRIRVDFTVSGDNGSFNGAPSVDPDFGTAISSGLFSLVTTAPPGGGVLEDFERGLGGEISFAFGGVSWTAANAAVGRLLFDPSGQLTFWQLTGAPAGLSQLSYNIFPDILVDPFGFSYTTPRSVQAGIFVGPTLQNRVTITAAAPVPAPEPMSLLLVATGLVGLTKVRRRSRSVRA